jgi:hypothetical protein
VTVRPLAWGRCSTATEQGMNSSLLQTIRLGGDIGAVCRCRRRVHGAGHRPYIAVYLAVLDVAWFAAVVTSTSPYAG